MSRSKNRRTTERKDRLPEGASPFRFGDWPVSLLCTSELHRPWFGADGYYARTVQEALTEMSRDEDGWDWHRSKPCVLTLDEVEESLPLVVVKRRPDQAVRYGRYKEHQDVNPDLSPFVTLGFFPRSHSITVELVGAPGDLKLIRAYGGEYVPPLPWQQSISHDSEAVFESYTYWQDHAFVMSGRSQDVGRLVDGSTLTDKPPRWARGIERQRAS